MSDLKDMLPVALLITKSGIEDPGFTGDSIFILPEGESITNNNNETIEGPEFLILLDDEFNIDYRVKIAFDENYEVYAREVSDTGYAIDGEGNVTDLIVGKRYPLFAFIPSGYDSDHLHNDNLKFLFKEEQFLTTEDYNEAAKALNSNEYDEEDEVNTEEISKEDISGEEPEEDGVKDSKSEEKDAKSDIKKRLLGLQMTKHQIQSDALNLIIKLGNETSSKEDADDIITRINKYNEDVKQLENQLTEKEKEDLQSIKYSFGIDIFDPYVKKDLIYYIIEGLTLD